MNKQRTDGYILVTALAFMVVLVIMSTIIMTGSVSGVQQAGGQSGLIRARAAAEAGQTKASFILSEEMIPYINTILAPYANTFAANKLNPSTTPVISSTSYTDVLNSLNNLAGLNDSGTVGNATYTSTITFSNFREDITGRNTQSQKYLVDYQIQGTGQQADFRRAVTVQGYLNIQVGPSYLNQYLILANDGGWGQGNYFATGMNYDGPVFVNQNWAFAGSPQFKMGAATAATKVTMYNCASKAWQSVNTQSNGCTTPDWGGFGLAYAQTAVPLPKNSYSQARAALGLDPTVTTAPTISNRCVALSLLSTCSVVPNGVYTPSGGGIYIQGDATVALSVATGNKQVYTITQGTQTTTITVDPSGQTKIVKADGTIVNNTVPPNGQLYVEGSITSLKGPARTGALPITLPVNPLVPSQIPPAIASTSKLNIAAATDVVVQGDITYQDNPGTNPSAQNVLAIIAGAGNVRVGPLAPNDVYIHGAVLAGASAKGLAVDNYNSGAPRGSIHMLGSLAEDLDPPRGVGSIVNNTVSIANGYGDDLSFDKRFLNGTIAPPYFPTTAVFTTKTTLPIQRSWTEK